MSDDEYRWRLREYPGPAELAEMYAVPHDHRHWDDHLLRVDMTIALGGWMLRDTGLPRTIADLSCGNAQIVNEIAPYGGTTILGDIAPGYEHHGPIEETVERLADDSVDLFVCSETIEHLEDPDHVLRRIRAKAHRLVLSTPIGEQPGTDNPQHIHGWSVEGVCRMLVSAGWSPVVVNELRLADYVYNFQLIACERI
jgi:SAM-dependent methyltransferase